MGQLVLDDDRLELMASHGADLTIRADTTDFKTLRKTVRSFAKERGIPSWRHRIFEASGTAEGQSTAFGLIGHGAYLAVVGFTPKKLELRLSNLMAFDATAQGNWGCPPEHYPAIVDLVLLVCEPLRHEGVYRFERTTLAARTRDAGFDLAFRKGFLRTPPPQTVFLHRKMVGTFLLCGRIRAHVDVRACIDPFL